MDKLLGKSFSIIDENNGFSSKFPSSYPSRAAVIIDGGYWRKLIETLNITNVDLIKLTDKISAPAYRFRTILFDGKRQENQSFHDSLRLLDRFEVFLGDVLPRDITCPHCTKRFSMDTQKRVDVALAVEIVHLATAKHVDLITLIAGDRDFLPAIETAKHAGVIIRLAHGSISTVSDIVLQSVDERIELNLDYFENNDINFDDIPDRTVTIVAANQPDKPITLNERTTTEIKAIEDLLVSLLKNLIQKTSKHEFAYSLVGNELNKVEPNWRELYHVKHLKDLISLAKAQVLYKRKDHNSFLSLRSEEMIITIQNKPDSAKSFIVNTIRDYYTENHSQNRPLSTARLGELLTKQNPAWKKKFKIKLLSRALQEYTDTIKLTSSNNEQIITLK